MAVRRKAPDDSGEEACEHSGHLRLVDIDSKKVNRSPDNPSIQSSRGVAEYILRYSKWMDDVDHMEIRVDWYNTVSPPGKALLNLTKP